MLYTISYKQVQVQTGCFSIRRVCFISAEALLEIFVYYLFIIRKTNISLRYHKVELNDSILLVRLLSERDTISLSDIKQICNKRGAISSHWNA